MKTKALVVLALLIGLNATASAATIYYQMTGNLTGSLGGNSFTNSLFTFDFTGDTTGITGTTVLLNPTTANSFLISGFSTATFSEATDVGVNTTLGIVGFSDPASTKGITFQNAGFIGWNLATSIGPLTGTTPFFIAGTFNTSLGALVLSDASNLSFTASLNPIPEPAPVALFGMGLAAIGFLKLRKRTKPRDAVGEKKIQ